ncbi:hypothetical protein NDU88_001620 [Pleurodeles waltl]|uniref:Uncharacterized protein n=1 Tax=Pleurodeles waltl TaxID=8319 RepID=A0AAV7LBI4_PLEWA|nr:hypothetical protein NDU88_001620 [Pleurodeles waltl]
MPKSAQVRPLSRPGTPLSRGPSKAGATVSRGPGTHLSPGPPVRASRRHGSAAPSWVAATSPRCAADPPLTAPAVNRRWLRPRSSTPPPVSAADAPNSLGAPCAPQHQALHQGTTDPQI